MLVGLAPVALRSQSPNISMASTEYVKLAQSLPPRLLRFFSRYPPTPTHLHNQETANPLIAAPITTSQDPNAGHETTNVVDPPYNLPSPFRSHKHPVTGVWHSPKFSLRQQADLVKLARDNGVEELLPYTPKKTDVRLEKRKQLGLRVKGTGEGQRVKGTAQERTMKTRLDRRRKAMLEMPALIKEWKLVSFISVLSHCFCN